jgi:hypothetical protein
MAGPHEVRVFAEGALRWAQASGTGGAWSTASAATTALVGFVQAGTQQSSAQRAITVTDRGMPKHHKVIGKDPISLTINFLQAVTANDPALSVTTSLGASTPMLHFELKSDSVELGNGSATYRQFRYAVLTDNQWSEEEEGNKCQQTWVCLEMNGPTASGYLG